MTHVDCLPIGLSTYNLYSTDVVTTSILTCALHAVGHGHSEGIRIDVDSFDSYVQDIISYVTDMKLQFPSLPLFYMGLHSTGTSVNSHLNRPVNPQYM